MAFSFTVLGSGTSQGVPIIASLWRSRRRHPRWWGGLRLLALSLVVTSLAPVQRLALAEAGGAEVAVVYNANFGPDSRLVAQHYAERRGVPAAQVIALPLPRSETITRAEFRAQLEEPLLRELETRQLITFHGNIVPVSDGRPGQVIRIPVQARIRYLVLCYGVPLRIDRDDSLLPKDADRLTPVMRRTEAAVDNELALLPQTDLRLRLNGFQPNAFRGATNAAVLHPTNGVLLVARLDGPSSRIAQGLVDKALAAETNGLWGRAYFDLRGLTNDAYQRGDDWIRAAAEVARSQGFDTTIDNKSDTFPLSFPLPQIALYAGWYAAAACGPFSRPTVEFLPGAFAYHLYSYSATTLRTPTTWAAALLEKGAAATIGYVYEPYLDATVDLGVLFSRWLVDGWTLGEAAGAAQLVFSWQTTVIGDPLYRVGGRSARERRDDLASRHSPLTEWAELRLVDLAQAGGTPARALIEMLSGLAITRQSAVLQQKLGELYELNGEPNRSLDAWRRALELQPSPEQQMQLQLSLARQLAALGRYPESRRAFERLWADEKIAAARLAFYQEALPIARRAGDHTWIGKLESEIERLRPPAAPGASPAKN